MEHVSRTSYTKNNYRRRNSGSEWGHIFLFYVLPFLIVNALIFFFATTRPKVLIVLGDTNDYLSAEATVTIKSWFPLKGTQFSMDSEPLPMEKGKKGTYTITVIKNGLIEATVKSFNGMSTTEFCQVNILDDNPPSLENTRISDGIVTFTISDSQSGVDFDTIYALNSQNQQVPPLSVDRASSSLSFEMDPAGLHVYAKDKAGNEVLGNFTSHKEGDTETLLGGVEEPDEHENSPEAQPETTAQAPEAEITIE